MISVEKKQKINLYQMYMCTYHDLDHTSGLQHLTF